MRLTRRVLMLIICLALAIGGIYNGIFYLLYQRVPFIAGHDTLAVTLAAAQAGGPRYNPAGGLTPFQQVPVAGSVLKHGRLLEGTLRSAILGDTRSFLTYLPPGYDNTPQRYPVLYLLHGAPGGYRDWVRGGEIDRTLDALISLGRVPALIAVLPDGSGSFLGDTEWANSGDRHVCAEDYLTQEVVPYIDGHFRTLADRDHRLIGGLSTGGFGAVNVALHHPELFGYVLSLSGNYLAGHTWTGKDPWSANQAAKAYNSPLQYVRQAPNARSLHIYLAVGTSDTALYQQTKQFDTVLSALKVAHRTQYFPGNHSWTFWRTHVIDGLEYLVQALPAYGSVTG